MVLIYLFSRNTKISHKFVNLKLEKIEHINPLLSLGMLDLQGFKSDWRLEEKRDIERKGTLYLLEKMLNMKGVELEYNEFKRPFLKGRNEHISISHSHQWLAISLHKTHETGVDVELIREKVINIKDKFLCDSELEFAGVDIYKLTLLWSAKEAIYKVHGKKELEFKKIVINKFELKEEGELMGTIHFEKDQRTYKLYYRKFEHYFLALVLNEL